MSVCAAIRSAITRPSSAAEYFAACAVRRSASSSVASSRSCWPGAVLTSSRLRKCESTSLVTCRRSCPSCTSRFTSSNTPLASPTATASASAYCTSERAAADQRQDDVLADLAGAEHRGLVEQRERVADRTLRLARDRVRGLRGERHALVLRDAFEVLGDGLDRDAAEVEPLATPDDRGRHLVRLGRREDEPDADRRLLEHLQQRVERLARQPLRLVDDVDLLAALDRRGGRLLAELARVVDAAVGGRVDLDHVQVLPVPDGHALIARAARLGRGAGLAVDHLGQDPGRRGLAGPARSAEQERVRQPALADGARERPDDVVLTEHLLGALRAVLAVQRLVRLVVGHIHLRAPRARLDPRGEAREVRQSLGGGRAPAVDRGELERITGR